MVKDKIKKPTSVSRNVQEILRERERLDQILQQEFQKEVIILFTDIYGYTEYVDKRGDINGRTLLQKHNRILLPLIEKHGGKLIEMIGDAAMVCFSNPLDAVMASVAIQKVLYEENMNTEIGEQIHVKMGINIGKAIVDENAVYQSLTGDVANTASRIQSQADPDQILISKAVYDRVSGSEDILCKFHRTFRAKGKSQPLDIYQVVWRNEDIVQDHELKRRPYEPEPEKRGKQSLKLIELEISSHGDHLKISAHEKITGEESTIGHYEKMPFSIDLIQAKCREIVDILNKANRKSPVKPDVLVKLREIGQVLHDELIPLSIKEKLKKSSAEYLRLYIDDQLVQVPWELLNDGQQFLCQRFHMGRLVKTQQPILGIRNRELIRPLRMLIITDPEGDLKGAYTEGIRIRDYMDRDKDLINASLRAGNITPDSIKEKMRNFDFVHFAGHADYKSQNAGDSGWRLTSGSLKASDIAKMAGTSAMPSLIFSNACQSARTEEWTLKMHFEDEIFGLANSFLLSGVKHYVGTFWDISDEQSSHFALEFYKYLLSGMTIGEALQQSRLALIKEYGEDSIVWASYVLYGDPTFNYIEQIKTNEIWEEPEPIGASMQDRHVRARGEVIDFTDRTFTRNNRFWLYAIIGIALLVTVIFWRYPGFLREATIKQENAARIYYNNGNFKEALNACRVLEDKNPKLCLIHLIRGNISLTNGDLDEAHTAYQKALQTSQGTDMQKANALIGLGRIASFQMQPDLAINYYQKATEVAPESEFGYLSQALLLEGKGNYDEALHLFEKAQALSPQDKTIKAITNEIHKKLAFARDQHKRDRIDKLVNELLETMKQPTKELRSDGWTSRPLTMWVMDFGIKGYSLQERQERLLVSGIIDQMLEYSRAQLVERELFDRLAEELKLGTSELVDRSTVLSLGNILAARLILSGQIVYSGPQAQVSMHLIETETGRITAAINESFGSSVPASILAERLSKSLVEKLKKLYPLRGKISEVKGEEIKLNIGKMVGVSIGQKFKIIDQDIAIEVTDIQQETSLAKTLKGEGPLQNNVRIEAI